MNEPLNLTDYVTGIVIEPSTSFPETIPGLRDQEIVLHGMWETQHAEPTLALHVISAPKRRGRTFSFLVTRDGSVVPEKMTVRFPRHHPKSQGWRKHVRRMKEKA